MLNNESKAIRQNFEFVKMVICQNLKFVKNVIRQNGNSRNGILTNYGMNIDEFFKQIFWQITLLTNFTILTNFITAKNERVLTSRNPSWLQERPCSYFALASDWVTGVVLDLLQRTGSNFQPFSVSMSRRCEHSPPLRAHHQTLSYR